MTRSTPDVARIVRAWAPHVDPGIERHTTAGNAPAGQPRDPR